MAEHSLNIEEKLRIAGLCSDGDKSGIEMLMELLPVQRWDPVCEQIALASRAGGLGDAAAGGSKASNAAASSESFPRRGVALRTRNRGQLFRRA